MSDPREELDEFAREYAWQSGAWLFWCTVAGILALVGGAVWLVVR